MTKRRFVADKLETKTLKGLVKLHKAAEGFERDHIKCAFEDLKEEMLVQCDDSQVRLIQAIKLCR